jgi:hypothetical protein
MSPLIKKAIITTNSGKGLSIPGHLFDKAEDLFTATINLNKEICTMSSSLEDVPQMRKRRISWLE